MVLMAVGNKDAADFLLVTLYIGKIRNDKVDAEHVGLRKCESAVHNDHVPIIVVQGHVLTDFIQTAEK